MARWATFRRDTAWQSKPHKALFLACAGLLSFYLSYVLFLANSPIFTGTLETAASVFWFAACAALFFAGLVWGCRKLAGISVPTANEKGGNSPGFMGISLALSLLLLGCSFLACYPGGVSYDVYNQWVQAQTGLYNGWHPVFHTLLMGLGMRLAGRYPWVVAMQIVCFGGALAYLMDTLRAWGVPKALLLIAQGLIVASPLVDSSLMYLWKDNAMTMGAVVLCAYSVNVYFTRGAWLDRPRNAVLTGLALAFTTLVRHNAMFYTVPLLLCLLLCYRARWKRLLLAAGVTALCLGLVTGVVYSALDIIQPENTLEESVGIPMTVLMDARLKNPEALDAETAAFLRELADDELFAAKYREGNYNSIKFEYPRERISRTPPDKLLRMVASAVAGDPRTAFAAVNNVTDLVWDVTGKGEGTESVRNSGDLAEYPFLNTRWNQLGKSLQKLIQIPLGWPPVTWVFRNIGVQQLALLLCALWALYRSGPRALPLCVPVLLYNLGTMLLLCGNDARFFQFSMVISIPTMFALCREPGGRNEEQTAWN